MSFQSEGSNGSTCQVPTFSGCLLDFAE